MTPFRRRWLTSYMIIGVFFLLGGIEYAVILPTLWLYIKARFGNKLYFLGLILSAFSLSGLLANPLMGRWSDQTGNTKAVLLVANLFEVTGNIMYFMGLSGWFLVASRFVAGIGTGVGSAIFADVCRVTTPEERTAVVSMLMAVRQIGLLVGPGFNLFLRECNFSIGPYVVDKFTAPGVFMAALWLVFEVIVLVFYNNLPQLKLEEELAKERLRSRSTLIFPEEAVATAGIAEPVESVSAAESADGVAEMPAPPLAPPPACPNTALFSSSDELLEGAEAFMRDQRVSRAPSPPPGGAVNGGADPPVGRYDVNRNRRSGAGAASCSADAASCSAGASNVGRSRRWTLRYYYDEFMREEVVVLLAVIFSGFFNQMVVETMATPLTARLLQWGEIENSIMYCAAGLEVMIVFFVIRCLSRRYSDRLLLLFSLVILSITIAFLLWFIPQATPDHWLMNLICLIVGVATDLFGLPFLLVASASLYSKVIGPETQGFGHGLRRVSSGLGMILGPLWVAGLGERPYIMLGTMMALNVFVMVLLCISYRRLDGATRPASVPESTDGITTSSENIEEEIVSDANERQPLLTHRHRTDRENIA